jgi:threonine synthase
MSHYVIKCRKCGKVLKDTYCALCEHCVYKSEGLAERLGLDDLYIAFNGYWPERDANIATCTFKEFEAAVVLENARGNDIEGMIVASAGNTARAFAHLSVVTGFPVIIVVPRMCLFEMWYLEGSLKVPTLALESGDYADAIDLARKSGNYRIGISRQSAAGQGLLQYGKCQRDF